MVSLAQTIGIFIILSPIVSLITPEVNWSEQIEELDSLVFTLDTLEFSEVFNQLEAIKLSELLICWLQQLLWFQCVGVTLCLLFQLATVALVQKDCQHF